MHSSLESILRQVMADVKVLDAPPNSVVSELRKTKKKLTMTLKTPTDEK